MLLRSSGSHLVGLLITVMFYMTGCAHMAKTVEQPTVQLVSMKLQQASLLEQRYRLKIRIQNPNDYSLDVDGVSFNVDIGKEPFANGVSSQPVSLPALGETTTDIMVSSNLLVLLSKMQSATDNLTYRLYGKVKIVGVPSAISFESEGDFNQLARSGKLPGF